MRSWQPRESHDAVTVWGQGGYRVSKVAASQKKTKKKYPEGGKEAGEDLKFFVK